MDLKRPTDDFIQTIDVHELLPQQEPFVMVDRLLHFENKNVLSEKRIKEDNIFIKNNEFLSTGLLENIAQTCAARIGYINKYILHKDVTAGLLGAVKSMEIIQEPQVGDTIITKISVLEEVFNLILVHAEVICKNNTIAIAEIKMAV